MDVQTGQRFGRFVVLADAPRRSGARAYCCVCDCGENRTVDGPALTRGLSQSCGCLKRERTGDARRSHGRSGDAIYRIWCGIKTRCSNPGRREFSYYGGRGISVCERWRDGDGSRSGFECFVADMGERPSPDHSVERIDNDGNYDPNNCVWATTLEQRRNTSATYKIAHGGEVLSTAAWSERTGIPALQIGRRIGRGWSVDRALTQRPKAQPRRTVRCA